MINQINKKYFLLAVSGTKIGKSSDVDIAVRCPVCGDSNKNKNSTRLHLFHKNKKDGIKCFNGDCKLSEGVYNIWGFLKTFYPNLLDSYKRETFQNNLYDLSNKQNDDVFSGITENTKPQDNTVTSPVTTHNLFNYFEDIIEHDEALEYLKNRVLIIMTYRIIGISANKT